MFWHIQMNKLPAEKRVEILAMLFAGKSVREVPQIPELIGRAILKAIAPPVPPC
jgi:hypothetical protein